MFAVPLAAITDLKLRCLVLFASIGTRWTPFPQEPTNPQLRVLSNSYLSMKISLFKARFIVTLALFLSMIQRKKERATGFFKI